MKFFIRVVEKDFVKFFVMHRMTKEWRDERNEFSGITKAQNYEEICRLFLISLICLWTRLHARKSFSLCVTEQFPAAYLRRIKNHTHLFSLQEFAFSIRSLWVELGKKFWKISRRLKLYISLSVIQNFVSLSTQTHPKRNFLIQRSLSVTENIYQRTIRTAFNFNNNNNQQVNSKYSDQYLK